MNEIATIEFVDVETKQAGVAVVRTAAGYVGLCLSLSDDGDVEAFLPVQECKSLIAAMSEAIRQAAHADR